MATYTSDDINGSKKFSQANEIIRLVREFYKAAPHLASWTKITIRDATNDDYYIPATLIGKAKIVKLEFTKELCEVASCTSMKEMQVCDPNEPALYYRIGTDKFQLQCHPACFHTAFKQNVDADGKRAVDVPQLQWNNDKCNIMNSSIITYLEKTFIRSETKFEFRVNDMPTGFSQIPSDKTTSGFTYITNAQYCKYYDREIDDDGSCVLKWWEKALDCVLGMSLINTIKSSVRLIVNDGVPFDLPTGLPPMPTEIPKKFTLDGWKSNINKDFVLPDLIDTTPSINLTTDRSKYSQRNVVEMMHQHQSGFMRKLLKLPKLNTSSQPKPIHVQLKETETWGTQVRDIIGMILKMFTEAQTYETIAADLIVRDILSSIKEFAAKLATKAAELLAKDMAKISGEIGVKVMSQGLRVVLGRTICSAAIRMSSKIAIAVSKLLTAAVSVVGWILMVGMFLDIIFSIWDPFGYNNMFPPEIPNDLMLNGEYSLRQAMGTASVNYEVDNLIATVIGEDKMVEIQLESLLDTLIYLDALVVNSEGSRIDKGDLVNFEKVDDRSYEDAVQRGVSEQHKWTPESYEKDCEHFSHRIKSTHFLNKACLGALFASGLMLIGRLYVLAAVVAIIAVGLLAVARLNLQSDLITEFVDKYTFKFRLYGKDGFDY